MNTKFSEQEIVKITIDNVQTILMDNYGFDKHVLQLFKGKLLLFFRFQY